MSNGNAACIVCSSGAESCWVKSGYTYYRCRFCRHLFVWPMPAVTSQIYSKSYFEGGGDGFGYPDYDHDKQAMSSTFTNYLDRITRLSGQTGRLLDIGAATGFFMGMARDRGWRVWGVEVSDHASETARSRGFDVRTGVLTGQDFEDSSFDAITMWDVIEHMEDPKRDVIRSSSLLKSGGVLAINTPDAGSLVSKLAGVKWHLVIPPEHLNLFSRQSLRILLESCGFEVLETTTLGKRFTVQYVADTLSHVFSPLKGIAARVAGTRLGRANVSINLYDNVFMLARKNADAR
jgi:cyclopropane fatty-acyl-phospholipid synthase-like methyltransferase